MCFNSHSYPSSYLLLSSKVGLAAARSKEVRAGGSPEEGNGPPLKEAAGCGGAGAWARGEVSSEEAAQSHLPLAVWVVALQFHFLLCMNHFLLHPLSSLFSGSVSPISSPPAPPLSFSLNLAQRTLLGAKAPTQTWSWGSTHTVSHSLWSQRTVIPLPLIN